MGHPREWPVVTAWIEVSESWEGQEPRRTRVGTVDLVQETKASTHLCTWLGPVQFKKALPGIGRKEDKVQCWLG